MLECKDISESEKDDSDSIIGMYWSDLHIAAQKPWNYCQ